MFVCRNPFHAIAFFTEFDRETFTSSILRALYSTPQSRPGIETLVSPLPHLRLEYQLTSSISLDIIARLQAS